MSDAPTPCTSTRPVGREAVIEALTEATIDLIVDQGLHVSVRQIAARAGVNHGLIHTYFGSKQGLLSAAADEINRRASEDADPSGFPPPDLAERRRGELAKALARIRLDAAQDLFSSHPVTESWKAALASTQPTLRDHEINTMIATSSALGLGWAMFADHLCELLDIDEARRAELNAHVAALVAELGGIPDSSR